MDFQYRHEWKHELNTADLLVLRARLRAVMESDPHAIDGKLSMIPWDYNLAFGTFQAGDASGAVNDPIDSPLSVSGDGSRPMADWIFQNEEYTQLYHQYFAEFLDEVDITGMIDETYALIAPYVEKDPTAFCTYEEFETGVAALRSFCEKRSESVRGQLDGTIPSTDEGQEADSSALIDASGLTLSDMGSMGGGGFGGGPGGSFGPGGDAQSGQGFPSPGSGFGGDSGFGSGGGPGMSFETQSAGVQIPWDLLILSLAVLFGGLLAAVLYRKRS
ncbi:MAG: CotH kinase family protein [Oscillospiraceae bacterium]|nr:CotH kinase family protein [Oscillospiraceae bacterium]